MADIIIVLIVVVLLGLALKGSVKHFKGEGACCGGGGGSISVDIPQKRWIIRSLAKRQSKFPECTVSIVSKLLQKQSIRLTVRPQR